MSLQDLTLHVRLLHTYITSCNGSLSAEEKAKLRGFFEERSGSGTWEMWGAGDEQVQAIQHAVA
jgi:hypothetical protein